MKSCLVCIAKDEGRFVTEWLAHHLAIGFDRIVVYDHDSSDATALHLDSASRLAPVHRIPWRVDPQLSPQVSAYNHALESLRGSCDWLGFLDADEFLVFRKPGLDVNSFLSSMPPDVGAVGVNWLTFGSSGLLTSDYGLVSDAFRTGGPRSWGNNRHIKTIGRPSQMRKMGIHDCELISGRYVSPSGAPLTMSRKRGIADHVDHTVAQVHHYQSKSLADFRHKIERGRAGKRMSDPTRIRQNPEDFFRRLDRNSHRYDDIDVHRDAFERVYGTLVGKA